MEISKETEDYFNKKCEKLWIATIKLVSEEAPPEDFRFIEKHKGIFYKMCRQGMLRGWSEGGFEVFDLLGKKLQEEGMDLKGWHEMYRDAFDLTKVKQ